MIEKEKIKPELPPCRAQVVEKQKDAEKNIKPLQSKPTSTPNSPKPDDKPKNKTLPEIPKKEKPSDAPDDDVINESILGRIKTLMNKILSVNSFDEFKNVLYPPPPPKINLTKRIIRL